MSVLSQELIDAYLKTEYRVETAGGEQVLRVGESSPFLAGALRAHRAVDAAYITACNPYSHKTGAAANRRRMAQLHADIVGRWLYCHGEGVDVSGVWGAEPSFLIFGINLADAAVLSGKYEQNAFVYASLCSDESATPCLVFPTANGYHVHDKLP